MREILGYASFALSMLAMIPYVIDVLKGNTKPERIAWLLWSILGFIYFVSAVIEDGAIWFTLGTFLGPLVALVLSVKFGVGGKSALDRWSLFIASTALVFLLVTGNAIISLLIALFVDSIGSFLTIRKIYYDPTSESKKMWLISTIAAFLGLFSVENISFENLAFPIYLIIVTTTFTSMIHFGNRKNKVDISEL